MTNSFQCPNCMGNKTASMGNGVYKCLYCGSIFAPQPNESPNVEKQTQQPQPPTTIVQQPQVQPQFMTQQPIQYVGGKSKSTATILGLCLGCFGVARFYVGDNGLGIFYLLLTIILSLISFGFGFIFVGSVLCLIDFIYFLSMNESTFNQKYNHRS